MILQTIETLKYMAFNRVAIRTLPSGKVQTVHPFHISLEGLEKAIICRDDEDYDVLVKCMFVCSRRKDVIVVAYCAVSNHGHLVVLAVDWATAKSFGEEVKRIYAMWFNHKYKENNVMMNADVNVLLLDSDWYVKNAVAYDIRNALDNSDQSISDYLWTSFRGLFCNGQCPTNCRDVSSLSQRERKKIFRTNDDLSTSGWKINEKQYLEPASCCDWQYAEEAFGHSQPAFFSALGNVNIAEMQHKMIDGPRKKQIDAEFYKTVNEVCNRWFKKDVSEISLAQKTRILPYLYHTTKTSVSQLARIFNLEQEKVAEILRVRFIPRKGSQKNN